MITKLSMNQQLDSLNIPTGFGSNCVPGPKIDFKDKIVLDIGCRSGDKTIEIAHKDVREIIGIDPELQVKNKYPNNCKFYEETVQNFSQKSKNHSRFDIVTLFLWNINNSEYDSVMKSIKKVLKNDGILIISYYDDAYKDTLFNQEYNTSVFSIVRKYFGNYNTRNFPSSWDKYMIVAKGHNIY